jgi:hypothetical protein
VNALEFRDRVRHAIQDGATSDGEVLAVARLEDLSDQVMQQATPTATSFQVRFTQTPTQGYVTTFVVPGTLQAFVDESPEPVEPSEDVNANGVFTLPAPPEVILQVSYAYAYFTDKSLDALVSEAIAWLSAPAQFAVDQVPAALVPAVVDKAASRALRALAAKCARAVTAKSGDSSMDFSDLAKSYSTQAKEREGAAETTRAAYYTRADSAAAPVGATHQLHVGGPFTPVR